MLFFLKERILLNKMRRTENRIDKYPPRVSPFTKDFSFQKELMLNLQMNKYLSPIILPLFISNKPSN